MAFPIPQQGEPIATSPTFKVTQAWYAFLYHLKLRLTDGKVLFSNNGEVAEATVGAGLTLDRTTNTLSADAGDGFPEAPLDGAQYGRQMAQWTVITPGTGGTTSPGLPQYSIQFNNPTGTFDGSADFLFDETNKYVWLGSDALNPYTIQPIDVAVTGSGGVDLTIKAGEVTGAGIDPGGDLFLEGGIGAVSGIGGTVWITSGLGAAGVGSQASGAVRIKSDVSTGITGLVELASGDSTSSGQTGPVYLYSGDCNSGNGRTGDVHIETGRNVGGAFGDTGDIYIAVGSANNSVSGQIEITVPNAIGAAIPGQPIIITSGGGTTTQRGGDVEVTAGSSTGAGGGGDIVLTPGASTSGTSGAVDLNLTGTMALWINGDAGTNGQPLISSGAGLPPTWGGGSGGAPSGGIYGGTVGVPYFVTSGTKFTVPDLYQALFVLPIEVEGTLEVSGYLIEMSQ